MDRLVAKEGIEKRLADSMETAVRMGQGTAMVEDLAGEIHVLQRKIRMSGARRVSWRNIAPALFI